MRNSTKGTLDRIFSEYIRQRDADGNGLVRCYCCGKILFWKNAQNMHFIPRQHLSLRFNEINCHAGCVKCNYYNNGNIEEYALHLKKDYGNDIIDKLVATKHQHIKISDFEYKIMIKKYRELVKELKLTKGF
jgi:hypothetical protein